MRQRSVAFYAIVTLVGTVTACAHRPDDRSSLVGHQRHDTKFVFVNGVRLQYLDWRGTGDGLVFLHGIGDSPHAFDDLAVAFVDRFRVIAYARRGHGRSDVRGPYDNDTLVADLRGLLDELGVQRAVLVGWSLGGNEITEFAARHPERVTGVVYLDCFDTTDPRMAQQNEHFPVSFFPEKADLSDVAAFRAWQKRTWWSDASWTSAMEAHADDLVDRAPDGSLRLVTSDSVTAELFAGAAAYRARWQDLRAPVLAFFAEPYPDAFLGPGTSAAQRTKVDQWLRQYATPYYESRILEFKAALPKATVVTLERTNHAALPFQRHRRILEEIESFLARLPKAPLA
jgi:pimeloyl-ACP methyl ester carboxylesterase